MDIVVSLKLTILSALRKVRSRRLDSKAKELDCMQRVTVRLNESPESQTNFSARKSPAPLAVSAKLLRSQILVGLTRTRYH